MTANEKVLINFYTAFVNADSTAMCEYYPPKIQFHDPAFDQLTGNDVCQIWKIFVEKIKVTL